MTIISLFRRTAPVTACRASLVAVLLAALLAASAGCEREHDHLTLADLTPDEYRYIERMVVLERAKTVALVDRPAGDALLDSLAAAWGDSSLPETLAGAPRHPVRSARVAELLRRVLAAEQDSLLVAPGVDRTGLPLPDPPPVAEEPPSPDEDS